MDQTLPATLEDPPEEEQIATGWTLKKLSTRHKDAASLLAQGEKRQMIAAITQFSEGYISFLTRQPLFKAYVKEMGQFSEERLKALFDEAVDVIADTMKNGTEEGRLKAVRLQMEATGRIGRERAGRGDGQESESLNHLADRLVDLMRRKREEHGQQATVEGTFTDVSDSEQLHTAHPRAEGEPENAPVPASTDAPANSQPPKDSRRRMNDLSLLATQP